MDWDFTLGVILGIILTAIGSKLTIKFQAQNQKRILKNFCEDSISNINEYISYLNQHRDKTGIIVIDFIDLISAEIEIYGRNREHLSIIEDKEIRKEIRDYFSETAIQLVRVRAGLNGFYQSNNSSIENARQLALQSAHKACDQLADVALRKKDLLLKISNI